MKFQEIEHIRKELDFIGSPLNDKMDHDLRVEHAGYAKKSLDNLEKKLRELPDDLDSGSSVSR